MLDEILKVVHRDLFAAGGAVVFAAAYFHFVAKKSAVGNADNQLYESAFCIQLGMVLVWGVLLPF
ncbi:MAG: hypothetical protein PHV34_23035 [Verrucomicrobiae bacterium]|nr:hypothetical protein [Verrucomicrobiae bacterium]